MLYASMNSRTHLITVPGPAGLIQLSIDLPDELKQDPHFAVRGLGLIAHPHPLLGGTMDNKVVQTLARTFNQLGYVSVRPNFRGVGLSAGTHDEGRGELDDLLMISDWMRTPQSWLSHLNQASEQAWITKTNQLPLVLAGFSFGSYVGSHLVHQLGELGKPVERFVMVGSAAGKWKLADSVPADTIVIHGENDETIPLLAVFDWARPQELTVHVVPGADHFFHRKLHCIRNIILSHWLGQVS
jgi:alpha/beta superfamily hydrolase